MQNKSTILYLSTRIRAGYFGTEKFLDNLLSHLPEYEHIFLGYDDPIYNIFQKRELQAIKSFGGFEPDGWKKKIFSPISFLAGIVEFVRFYKLFKRANYIVLPAAIIAESIWVLPLVRLFFGTKIISIIHKNECPDHIAYNPFFNIYKASLRNGIQVFVSHSSQKEWLAKNAVVKNSLVIHNGIPIFKYEVKQKNTDLNTINIGFLGRIHLDKGLDLLAPVLERIKTTKKIVLQIAGEGEDYELIRKLFEGLNLPKNVEIKWLGYVSDTKTFFESMDLLIYPSRKEAFALVLLEAYERGLPVLTSNIPSFLEAKEYFGQLEKNLIFESENSRSLEEKLNYFLSNIDKYRDFGYKVKLHEATEKYFSTVVMVDKYKNLFNS